LGRAGQRNLPCKEGIPMATRNNSPSAQSRVDRLDRDCVDVSLSIFERKRPDPTDPRFFWKVHDPTPFECCVATMASTLRRQVENGRLSQSEADRQLAEYRSRPFELPPNTAVFMAAQYPEILAYCEARGWKDASRGRGVQLSLSPARR